MLLKSIETCLIIFTLCATEKIAEKDAHLNFFEKLDKNLTSLGYTAFSDKLRFSLRNHHMVMIGDSIMRHQYLSLVYLLTNLTIPDNYAQTPHKWYETYVESTSALKHYEFCDCFRQNTYDYDNFIENRFWHDPLANISVTYLQYFGKDLNGHWFDKGDSDEYRQPRAHLLKRFWAMKIEDVIRKMLPIMSHRVSILMINYDHWDFSPHRKPFTWDRNLSGLVWKAAVDILHLEDPSSLKKFVWKTGTFGAPSFEKAYKREMSSIELRDSEMCNFPHVTCFNLSWVKLPSDYYVDAIHTVTRVTDVINFQFLNEILSEQTNS